ncbi:Hypothetical predicted protein [Olea europaea subsp. europaea]|uniref:Uncharacterized protein n=1 Tax=Olea europaea subsp. europaea TaxID=158383 RepID=A0A8S0R3E8_OLEEU|nr:Hypothetical predicted protein [Olea europaea subsp. europaea]
MVFDIDYDVGLRGFLRIRALLKIDWVKDEALGGGSSSINDVVNEAPDKKDEELPILFDGPARISEKRSADISLHMTFNKEKGIEKCDGKGRTRFKGVI